MAEDVNLCLYTRKEIINYSKGEQSEWTRSLSSPFPNIRLCSQRGLNDGLEHEALALAVVVSHPTAPLLALTPKPMNVKSNG